MNTVMIFTLTIVSEDLGHNSTTSSEDLGHHSRSLRDWDYKRLVHL